MKNWKILQELGNELDLTTLGFGALAAAMTIALIACGDNNAGSRPKFEPVSTVNQNQEASHPQTVTADPQQPTVRHVRDTAFNLAIAPVVTGKQIPDQEKLTSQDARAVRNETLPTTAFHGLGLSREAATLFSERYSILGLEALRKFEDIYRFALLPIEDYGMGYSVREAREFGEVMAGFSSDDLKRFITAFTRGVRPEFKGGYGLEGSVAKNIAMAAMHSQRVSYDDIAKNTDAFAEFVYSHLAEAVNGSERQIQGEVFQADPTS